MKARDWDRARGTERERRGSEGQSEGQRGIGDWGEESDAERMGMGIGYGTKFNADSIADKMLTKELTIVRDIEQGALSSNGNSRQKSSCATGHGHDSASGEATTLVR